MTAEPERAKKIFLHFVADVPADRWEEDLDAACGGDPELGARVRAPLQAHAQADSFLERAAAVVFTIGLAESSERPGWATRDDIGSKRATRHNSFRVGT